MSLRGGGSERVIAMLTSNLAKNYGADVTLATFDGPDDEFFYDIHHKVKVDRLEIGHTKTRTKLSEFLRRIFKIRRYVKKTKPDLIVGFNSSSYMLLWFSLIKIKVPMISSEHSSFEYFKGKIIERSLLYFSSLFEKKIIVISDITMNTFPSSVRKNMTVILNPLISSDGESADVDTDQSGNVILSVGRLTPEKNHSELIRAFSIIANKIPKWNLRIIGDGELRASLMNLVDRYGLSKRVELPGSKKNISEEYLKAKFLVIPSKFEGFGLVAAEAISHGLPVIGFNECNGIKRIIKDNENGIIVKTRMQNRIKSLSNSILKLSINESLRKELSDNCKIPDGFDEISSTQKWLELFKSQIAK